MRLGKRRLRNIQPQNSKIWNIDVCQRYARRSLSLLLSVPRECGLPCLPWCFTPECLIYSDQRGSRADACAQTSSDFALRSDLRSGHNCGFGFAESSLRTLRVLRCISASRNVDSFAHLIRNPLNHACRLLSGGSILQTSSAEGS